MILSGPSDLAMASYYDRWNYVDDAQFDEDECEDCAIAGGVCSDCIYDD